jgi:hypothetical protein
VLLDQPTEDLDSVQNIVVKEYAEEKKDYIRKRNLQFISPYINSFKTKHNKDIDGDNREDEIMFPTLNNHSTEVY